jgi:hypothetical protein
MQRALFLSAALLPPMQHQVDHARAPEVDPR